MSAKKVKSKSCHSCNKEKILLSFKEDQYNQRLAYIKQQILSKLGMNMQFLEASSLVQSSVPLPETAPKVEPLESDKIFIFPTVKRLNIPQFNISIAKSLEFSVGLNSIKKITLFVKQLPSLLTVNIDDNSVESELTVISTAVPVNGVLTRYQDISNMRVLGIVSPQTVADKQSLPNWIQYDLTDLLKPEIIKTNKLVSFDSESYDMKDSFITVEHNYNNREL
ncbi:unnamed protein product [Medioppia subpectinata]|uniref:Uncharacterized protein n=1 Tax=Medioppia subpectinata TaxID=1979941 RepID=A0A7R9KVI8_9ACAR|nr:unnamed protein product [Medioppia subpectinata]CAG2110641.1 unnamed protein product [Medioppia subpectinata]